MSVYPPPKTRNGSLNLIFNSSDYIKIPSISGGGPSIAENDARYLKNSGTVISSAATTFNSTLNVASLTSLATLNVSSLATIQDVSITGTLKAKQSTDTLIPNTFSADQSYSFLNGMVYSISSDTTTVNSVSFVDIPTTTNQSYIFTFVIKPSEVDSPYYIKPSGSNTILVNGTSVPLYGLQNVSLPANYTYLVQQISVIYVENGFISLTSVAGY
jgi:hypothetical protein